MNMETMTEQPNIKETMQFSELELNLLLEAIYQKYGYDFRNYARPSLRRRISQRMKSSNVPNLAAMQHLVLSDSRYFHTLLFDLSINVTEMFRDPGFYMALRESVIPLLKTYPFVKIWHAGCSTGEEVYSMAVLLREEKILDKSLIYATDFNQMVLSTAREGIYPLNRIKEYTQNYHLAGGKEEFSNYYTAKFDAAIMDKSLKKNIVFAQHNLATDTDFGEMHLILCRNVLIYFDRKLQERVIGLFDSCLVRQGILCLGSKESLLFSSLAEQFRQFDAAEKIYQKRIRKESR